MNWRLFLSVSCIVVSLVSIPTVKTMDGSRTPNVQVTLYNTGVVDYSQGSPPPLTYDYVKVQNGHLWSSNGSRLVLFGGFVFGDAQWQDEQFAKMASWGFNCIRTMLNLRRLDPVYTGGLNETYLSRIDSLISCCKRYGMYATITFAAPIAPYRPVWMTSDDQQFNSTTINEINRVWRLLADRYKGETSIVAFELPWNEVQAVVTSEIDAASSYDFTKAWNSWLFQRYGGTPSGILNATWSFNAISSLNSSENQYNWVDLSNGSYVRLPYSIQTNNYDGSDMRMVEFRLFVCEFLSNLTESFARSIRSVDSNHVLAMTFLYPHFSTDASIKYPFMAKAVPPSVGMVCMTAYPGKGLNETTKWYGLDYKLPFDIARVSSDPNRAVVISEALDDYPAWGQFNESDPWVEKILQQAYNGGVDGILWFASAGTILTDSNLELLPRYSILPQWATKFKFGTPERGTEIAVISGNGYVYQVLSPVLTSLNVSFCFLSSYDVDVQPGCIERFKFIIASPDQLSTSTLRTLRDYSDRGKGRIFLLGPWENDEHHHWRTSVDVGFYNWIVSVTGPNWGSSVGTKYGLSNPFTLDFSSDFGNITKTTTLSYMSYYHANTGHFPCTREDIIGFTVYANWTSGVQDYIALWGDAKGQVVCFYDSFYLAQQFTNPPMESIKELVRNFLTR